jgi:hypothetical protein
MHLLVAHTTTLSPSAIRVLDPELLLYRSDLAKELANLLWARRKSLRGTAVHRPGRSGHLAKLLDFVFVDKFDPTASDRFVVLCRGHSVCLLSSSGRN